MFLISKLISRLYHKPALLLARFNLSFCACVSSPISNIPTYILYRDTINLSTIFSRITYLLFGSLEN